MAKEEAQDALLITTGRISAMNIKAPKERVGKNLYSQTKLCLVENSSARSVAVLTRDPVSAQDAINAAFEADGKVEFPCLADKCQVIYKDKANGKQVAAIGVKLKKITVDGSKESERKIEIHYTEPSTKALMLFHYAHLGMEMAIEIDTIEPDLPDGNGNGDGEGSG